MESPTLRLAFDGGTIVVSGAADGALIARPGCQFEQRTNSVPAEGRHYRAIVEHLRQNRIEYVDEARAYQPTPWTLRTSREPFPHQTEAVGTWWKLNGRGVVVLPT